MAPSLVTPPPVRSSLSPLELRRRLRRRVLRAVLSRRRASLDITALQRLPQHVSFPLQRDGLDPVPALAAARRDAPVTRLATILGMDVWLVTGHAEARAVLSDATTYSNDARHLLGDRRRSAAEEIGGLGMTDPPDHTRLRRLLTPQFTARRLRDLQPVIDQVVFRTLDRLESSGPEADLVADFGFAIPFEVISELLGLPEADRATFHELGVARFDVSEGSGGIFGAATEAREFLIDLVGRRRRDPGPGLIGALIRDHGDELDDVELGGLADGVFLGGYETSASMLSMGAYVLSGHAEAREALRSGDPEAGDAVVEELLRYLCPVQAAFPRFARVEHELFGQRVHAGDVVVVSLTGANRDPDFVPTPEAFDPTQPAGGHLAFGHGLHRCVGAQLGRMELRTALAGLVGRFPDLAISVPPEELAFRPLSIVYGVDRLPARLW